MRKQNGTQGFEYQPGSEKWIRKRERELMKSWYNTENYRCKFVTKTIRIASNT